MSLCTTHWCVKVIFQSSRDITYVLWQSLSCPEAACPLVPCEVWLLAGGMLISFIFIKQNASELWNHAHHHAQLTFSSHSSVFQELHRWPPQPWSAANKNPNAASTHLFPPSGLSTCRLSWEPAPHGSKACLRFLGLHSWQFGKKCSVLLSNVLVIHHPNPAAHPLSRNSTL